MCLPNNPCLPSIHCHHSWIIIQMCEVQTAKSRSFQPHHVIHCSCSHSLLKFKGTQKAVQFSSDVSDDLQRWFLKVVLKIKEGPEKSGPQKSNRTSWKIRTSGFCCSANTSGLLKDFCSFDAREEGITPRSHGLWRHSSAISLWKG